MSFTKHKITVLKGVLGDIAVGQLGWLSQEERDKFWKNHNEYVEELKDKGEYGKPVEMTIEMEDDPLWDTPKQPKGNSIESHRLTFLKFD